jgi:hypothetical protein
MGTESVSYEDWQDHEVPTELLMQYDERKNDEEHLKTNVASTSPKETLTNAQDEIRVNEFNEELRYFISARFVLIYYIFVIGEIKNSYITQAC